MRQLSLIILLVLLVNKASGEQVAAAQSLDDEIVPYDFTHFPYKETVTNEKQWAEYESACEQSTECLAKTGVLRVRCVRECISPHCYNVLYRHDELEEGEVDVRLSSFKGCFLKKLKTRRV
ncbi:hypothetical protein HAZT_HAZT009411 [Hyalella azteca]|nr:hypothetical protein HAZT_HAZT009411 [Hyalella azteca]